MTLYQTPFVSFDIETTGLNSITHDIIEIGAVKFTLEKGVIDVFSSLVSTQQIIPENVIAIHGITNDMLIDAPPIQQVLEDFVDFIEDNYLLAHNAPFDTSFIGYEFGTYEMPYPENLIFDTLLLSRKLFPRFPSHSLSSLKEKFQIEVNRSHRALDDSLAVKGLFRALVQTMDKKNEKEISELIHQVQPISFLEFTKDRFFDAQKNIDRINQAIDDNRVITINYLDKKNNCTKRQILPSNLILTNGYVYLDSYCFLRHENRKFRLDRIQDIYILN